MGNVESFSMGHQGVLQICSACTVVWTILLRPLLSKLERSLCFFGIFLEMFLWFVRAKNKL